MIIPKLKKIKSEKKYHDLNLIDEYEDPNCEDKELKLIEQELDSPKVWRGSMNEKIKMRILHLIDLGARYENSSELKEIIDQHSKARELYENLLKSEENLTNFYGSIDDKKISERFDQIIEEGLNPKQNKVPWLKPAVGFAIAAGFLIFGFNFLKGSSLLDKQKTIYAVYDGVDGLLVGANVMINGLSIGNVTELDFLSNSTKILVTLKVKDKLNFSSKSTASIYETGVLGGLAISIDPIFERESIVKTGDTLNSSVRPGLTELINRQIEPLSRQLQSTITSVDSIFTGASNVLNRQTQEQIKESINVLTSAIKAINNSSIIIEKTLTDKNAQINNTIDNFEKISSNLSEVSEELNSFGLSVLSIGLPSFITVINFLILYIKKPTDVISRIVNIMLGRILIIYFLPKTEK